MPYRGAYNLKKEKNTILKETEIIPERVVRYIL